MSFRHHLHHLYDIYNGEVDVHWNRDWSSILAMIIFIILTGFLLPLASWMKNWCAASAWDHEDRWEGTKQFAITLLLFIYVPLLVNLLFFHVPLVPGPYFSRTLAWSNLLVLAPYVCIWWVVLLPLAPTLALVLERIDPRTRGLERVLLPGEQPLPQQPLEKTKVAKPARKKAATKKAGAIPKKRKKGRVRPLGELLLEEKALREQQARAGQQQFPPTALEGPTPTAEISASSSPPSSEPISPKKPDRGKRESLKELF